MKNLILILIVGLTFTACKKDPQIVPVVNTPQATANTTTFNFQVLSHRLVGDSTGNSHYLDSAIAVEHPVYTTGTYIRITSGGITVDSNLAEITPQHLKFAKWMAGGYECTDPAYSYSLQTKDNAINVFEVFNPSVGIILTDTLVENTTTHVQAFSKFTLSATLNKPKPSPIPIPRFQQFSAGCGEYDAHPRIYIMW